MVLSFDSHTFLSALEPIRERYNQIDLVDQDFRTYPGLNTTARVADNRTLNSLIEMKKKLYNHIANCDLWRFRSLPSVIWSNFFSAFRPFSTRVSLIGDPSNFIHPNSTIIGSVTLGKHVSIWPNVVLRGGTVLQNLPLD